MLLTLTFTLLKLPALAASLFKEDYTEDCLSRTLLLMMLMDASAFIDKVNCNFHIAVAALLQQCSNAIRLLGDQ